MKGLQKKCDDWEKRYQELEEEFQLFKKEQEKSPISLVKDELSKKVLEIHEL